MWCPLTGKTCQTTGCSNLYKMCQSTVDIQGSIVRSKDIDLNLTRQRQLENRIKELEQENANLRVQLFNSRAAAEPYKQY